MLGWPSTAGRFQISPTRGRNADGLRPVPGGPRRWDRRAVCSVYSTGWSPTVQGAGRSRGSEGLPLGGQRQVEPQEHLIGDFQEQTGGWRDAKIAHLERAIAADPHAAVAEPGTAQEGQGALDVPDAHLA